MGSGRRNPNARAWWWYNADKSDLTGFLAKTDYYGWEASVSSLKQVWNEHGPFDGVIGFSQGSAMAHLLCWLSEREEDDGCSFPKFECAVFVCGFPSRLSLMSNDSNNRLLLQTRTLHISGMRDTRAPPGEQRHLQALFARSSLLERPKLTHRLPDDDESVRLMGNFLRHAVD